MFLWTPSGHLQPPLPFFFVYFSLAWWPQDLGDLAVLKDLDLLVSLSCSLRLVLLLPPVAVGVCGWGAGVHWAGCEATPSVLQHALTSCWSPPRVLLGAVGLFAACSCCRFRLGCSRDSLLGLDWFVGLVWSDVRGRIPPNIKHYNINYYLLHIYINKI